MSENHEKRNKIKCPSCNAAISVDETDELIKCPYCDSVFSLSGMLGDSDLVKTTRIKAKTYKDVELAKIEANKEYNKKQMENAAKEEAAKYRKSKFGKITISCGVFFLLVFLAFVKSNFWCSLIALVQGGLMVTSWLMGSHIIAEKKPHLHTLLAVIGLLLMILFISSYSASEDPKNKHAAKWNDTFLNEVVPKPKTNSFYNYEYYDYSNLYSIRAYKLSLSDFNKYVDAIIEDGFEIESEKTDSRYSAYNPDGALIELSYYPNDKELLIEYNAPKNYGDIIWPSSEMMSYIPKPESNTGKVHNDNATFFSADVSNVSYDQYTAYVTKCIDSGFDVDYYRSDEYFRAENEDGIKLIVSYEGFNTINIWVDDRRGQKEEAISEDEASILCASDYKYKDYKEVQKMLEESGFSNISTEAIYDIVFGFTSEGEVDSVSINGKTDYQEGDVFKKDSPIIITYHMKKDDDPDKKVEENEQDESSNLNENSKSDSASGTEITNEDVADSGYVYYSSNDKSTYKNGNSGQYAYSASSPLYESYIIVDFDEGYVYMFQEGEGNTTCDKVAIESGDLNDVLIITYHDGGDSWSYGLHFRWKNQPDHLVLEDNDHFEYDYYPTDLSDALSLKKKKTIYNY